MRSPGFLLSRRWLLLAITVAVLAALAWRLGVWQFHRLDQRETTNAIVEKNVAADPVPVAGVLAVGDGVADAEQWKRVSATGEYVVDHTVLVRYQTRDGESGVDVVVPLRTEAGPALLVDRGWLASANRAPEVSDVPPPPDGEVTVTGWVRVDGTGDSTKVTDQSARAVSSAAIGEALGLEVYGGFIDLDTESPEADQPLAKAELPDLSNGPHFFYGLQWWFFGALAIFGFFYLLYDELRGPEQRRTRQRGGQGGGRRDGPSQGAQQATVDGQHDAVHEA